MKTILKTITIFTLMTLAFSCNKNDVLQISYVGFLTQDITVGNNSNFQIKLKEDQKVLDEVIGLFTKQSQIDNDRIQIRFCTDVEDALGLGRLYDLEFLLLQKV